MLLNKLTFPRYGLVWTAELYRSRDGKHTVHVTNNRASRARDAGAKFVNSVLIEAIETLGCCLETDDDLGRANVGYTAADVEIVDADVTVGDVYVADVDET
jgi:hypothetical protein